MLVSFLLYRKDRLRRSLALFHTIDVVVFMVTFCDQMVEKEYVKAVREFMVLDTMEKLRQKESGWRFGKGGFCCLGW